MVSLNEVQRMIVVGGGLAGMSVACRLAQSGLPITVLESSNLGGEATTRNQGWLHSGGWFATRQPHLAELCYQSLQQTGRFCPECLEADQEGMLYLFSRPETDVTSWTKAWDAAGIPHRNISIDQLSRMIPRLHSEQIQHAFLLPDRSFRPDRLLEALASTARNWGAEIRTQSPVTDLIMDGQEVKGVIVAGNEQILASRVILATGAFLYEFVPRLFPDEVGEGETHTPVILKSQMMALQPDLGNIPFCVVDDGGFNHIPHQATSVFSTLPMQIVHDPLDRAIEAQYTDKLWTYIKKYFQNVHRGQWPHPLEWSGTTLEVLQIDQIEPGIAPIPTVIDHSFTTTPFSHLWSVFPGRATLWPHLAEIAHGSILKDLGVQAIETVPPPWISNGNGAVSS